MPWLSGRTSSEWASSSLAPSSGSQELGSNSQPPQLAHLDSSRERAPSQQPTNKQVSVSGDWEQKKKERTDGGLEHWESRARGSCCLFASLLACAFSNGPHPLDIPTCIPTTPEHGNVLAISVFEKLKIPRDAGLRNTARRPKTSIRGVKRKKKGSAGGVWTASRECGSFATATATKQG